MIPPTGVLLVNVGTPDAPRAREVRRFLREFLGDPRVLDMNRVGRSLLLEGAILPFRPARSAEAYRKIWTDRGSPLLVHSHDFARALGEELGPAYRVALGMRYGRPSMRAALDELTAAGVDRVVVFPLYPQQASSTTGTTLEAAYRLAAARVNVPPLAAVSPFYDDPATVGAYAEVAAPVIEDFRPEHVLFSFHGLPVRHLLRADETGSHCLRTADCCATIGPVNRGCYRAQSFETARRLAVRLALDPGTWTVSFQSRLGRTEWIRPATDESLIELARSGVRRLAVVCPSFVADCLETLEEIGIRARESLAAHGGGELRLVPSLNAHPAWVRAAASLVRRTAGDSSLVPDPVSAP